MQSKETLPVKTIAFTSFLLAASSNLSFNPLITNQTIKKKKREISHKLAKKLKKKTTIYKEWRIDWWRNWLGIAKALTGGLHIVITATPSFPTSKSTLTDAISERYPNPKFVPFWIKLDPFASNQYKKVVGMWDKTKYLYIGHNNQWMQDPSISWGASWSDCSVKVNDWLTNQTQCVWHVWNRSGGTIRWRHPHDKAMKLLKIIGGRSKVFGYWHHMHCIHRCNEWLWGQFLNCTT